jgi:hypothetical protein
MSTPVRIENRLPEERKKTIGLSFLRPVSYVEFNSDEFNSLLNSSIDLYKKVDVSRLVT